MSVNLICECWTKALHVELGLSAELMFWVLNLIISPNLYDIINEFKQNKKRSCKHCIKAVSGELKFLVLDWSCECWIKALGAELKLCICFNYKEHKLLPGQQRTTLSCFLVDNAQMRNEKKVKYIMVLPIYTLIIYKHTMALQP